ncbi:MAG: peptide chain release factor N(5)-glutamine methyltransferase [Candidatus Aureabacteria bacterium]|nr:peptide chain release factor N(5)-glutamine methyltransferase [Candidatus Auribacterota bacterium]
MERQAGPKTNRIIDVINWGRGVFIDAEIPHARYTVEILLEHILGKKRAELYLDYDHLIPDGRMRELMRYIEKRLAHWPLWQLIGTVEFYGLSFRVNDRVLIPRPETELLVELALKELARLSHPGITYAADIGTGSGNIAVTLARQRGDLFIYAIDLSPDVLVVAEENARAHGVEGSISFMRGDLFEPFAARGEAGLECIVSNPPYVSSSDWADLPPEVCEREPSLALRGGEDGLDCIRRIIEDAPRYLKAGGVLLLEIGRGQAVAVNELVHASGDYGRVETHRDFAGIERAVLAERI